MYLLDTLYYLYKPEKRADLITICNEVSAKHNAPRCRVIFDMILCSLHFGAMWTEYGDLNFYERTWKNRATFITTFYNFKLYNKFNRRNKRMIFHDKVFFLTTFSDFVQRAWIDAKELPDEAIKDFLKLHSNIVIKAECGDSGKAVEVLHLSSGNDLDKTIAYIRSRNLNLIEEQIFNCAALKTLNPTSLNTLRIVTIRNNTEVRILFAGIRIGGIDAEIDNLSQGGQVAHINISTGVIDSPFYAKPSSHSTSCKDDDTTLNATGLQIPMWDTVISKVKSAATIIPDIRIIAWDVAVTPNGIDFVEGNESFGSVIMQLHYGRAETGLKPQLLEFLY